MNRQEAKTRHRNRRLASRRYFEFHNCHLPTDWPSSGMNWLIANCLRDAGFYRRIGKLDKARFLLREARRFRLKDWEKVLAKSAAEIEIIT